MGLSTVDEFPTITDEGLEGLRAMIGQEVRRGTPYIEELSRDAIRHYAHGMGDTNPLWCQPEYAQAAGFDDVLAPPTILFATDRILSGYVSGLPGVHAMFAGTDFTWKRRLQRGDVLRGTARLKDLIERPSKFAGRSVQQIYEVDFHDEAGELVAQAESWCFRTGRDAARDLGKYTSEDAAAPQIRWEPDQLSEIADQYRAQVEARRGTEPRHVEDVSVGDQLPQILKGPYTATTAISYLLGWGGLYVRAHGDAFDLYERHPGLAIPNEQGVPEPPERVHWDEVMAQRVGVPGAYDYGPERVSWVGHVVTDWMGDQGFLETLRVEVRRHNLLGELVKCSGTVTGVDRDSSRVHIDLHAEDHNGNESARGVATVLLSSRDNPGDLPG